MYSPRPGAPPSRGGLYQFLVKTTIPPAGSDSRRNWNPWGSVAGAGSLAGRDPETTVFGFDGATRRAVATSIDSLPLADGLVNGKDFQCPFLVDFCSPSPRRGATKCPPVGGVRPEHQPRQRRGQTRPHPRRAEQGPKLPTTAAEARAGASGPQGPGAEEPRRPPATQQNHGFVARQGRPSTKATDRADTRAGPAPGPRAAPTKRLFC